LKKGITVIAALVAVLAVTSGAFAAKQYMITSSKQIKHGAISLSNLSHRARRVLHGATGPSGPQGIRGDTGVQGPQGLTGATGARGDKGDTGAQGPQGLTGATGPQGLTGTTGARGPQGEIGPAGKDGTNGADGKVGPQGERGPQGFPGLIGPIGPRGLKGDKGDKGDRGAPGDSYLADAYYSVAYYDAGDTNAGAIATVACNAQTDTAISGGVQTIGLGDNDDQTTNVPVSSSFPGRMNWDTNTPKSNRLDGWIVQFGGNSNGSNLGNPTRVKVWALCVPGLSVNVTPTFTQSASG
jgi:hypothetical protein